VNGVLNIAGELAPADKNVVLPAGDLYCVVTVGNDLWLVGVEDVLLGFRVESGCGMKLRSFPVVTEREALRN
jgi:hypothetical protein